MRSQAHVTMAWRPELQGNRYTTDSVVIRRRRLRLSEVGISNRLVRQRWLTCEALERTGRPGRERGGGRQRPGLGTRVSDTGTVRRGPRRTDLRPTRTCGLSPSRRSHWVSGPASISALAYQLQTKHKGGTLTTVTSWPGRSHWPAPQAEKLLGTTGAGAAACFRSAYSRPPGGS